MNATPSKHVVRRRSLSLALGAALFLIPAGAFAADSSQAQIQLDYDKALNLAQQDNATFKQAQLNYASAQLNHQKTLVELTTSPSKIGQIKEDASFAGAQAQFDAAKEQLSLDVLNAYYGAIAAASNVSSAKQNLDASQQALSVTEAKIKAGLASDNDETNAQNNLLKAQAAYTSAQNGQEIALLNLLDTIGLPLDTQVTLPATAEAIKFAPLTTSLDDLLNQALTQSGTLRSEQTKLQIDQIQLQQDQLSSVPELTLKLDQNQLQSDQISVDATKRQIQIAGRNAYYGVQQKATQIQIAQNAVAAAQRALAAAQLRVKNGLDVPDSVDNAQADLRDAQQSVTQALLSYTVARENLLHLKFAGGN